MTTKKHLDMLSSDDLLRLQVRYDVTQSYEKVAQEFNISQTDVKKALQYGNSENSMGADAAAARQVREWVRIGIEAAKKKEIYGVNAVVTPELARALLALNTDNRNMVQLGLNYFNSALHGDRFKPTADGPSVSATGILNDGQHRLTAVLDTGVSANMFLHFGELDEARAVRDSGGAGKRTAAQALKIEFKDLPNSKVVATAARFVLIKLASDKPESRKVGHDEYIGLNTNGHLAALSASATAIGGVHRRTNASAGALTAVHFHIGCWTKRKDKFEEFWAKVEEPAEIKADDPRYALHKWLAENGYHKTRGKYVTRSDESARLIMGTIIRAWNKFVKGESVKYVAWSTATPFPKPL